MIVKFLEKEYSIPEDVLTYIDLLSFTDGVQKQLFGSFVRKLKNEIAKNNIGLLDDKDLAQEIEQQVGKYIAKLCDNGIFTRTISDYLKNNKGYQLISQVNKAALEKMKSLLIREMDEWQSGYENAVSNAESHVTGMGFSIWSSSFVNHAIYAAMEASKLKEQSKEAEAQYQKDMSDLRSRLDSQYGGEKSNYINNTYIPSMEAALTVFAYELLDKYISDLIANDKFDGKTLDYVDIGRSNDLLKNLTLSNNKHAILENAFAACPFNIAVYMNAMKYDCLDYTSFQTAETFKQGDKILSSLQETLGNSSNPQRLRLHFRSADLLSVYTKTPLREITAYMADFILDIGYAKTIALLSDKTLCRNILRKASDAEILQGDNLSKQKAAWLVDPIAPPVLWDKLTTTYGHSDLLDRIIALLPNVSNITTKEQLDTYLKEKLYEEFEVVRKELATEIKEKEAAQIAYEGSPKTRLKKFWLKYNMLIVIGVVVLAIIIWLANGPKTVDSGDGWSHQIDSFNELCEHCDGEEEKATHRIHYFFGNDYYCDECWEDYGEDYFERLKERD